MESVRSQEASSGPIDEVATLRQEVIDLKRQLEEFQRTVDALPLAMFWKDRESVYLGGNQEFATRAGVALPAELRARTDYDLVWKREESDAFRADDREVMTSGKAKLHIIETLRQADGHERWIETHKVPVRDATGQVMGLIGWFEDITERKQEEEEQAQRKDEMIRMQAEALQELASPLLPVAKGVLVMPLVGRIDQPRAQQVMATLLEGVVYHRARAAILDVTGVRQVDMSVMNAIVDAARAVRLLGAEGIVTGISPEMAQVVTQLDVELRDLVILSDLKSGIAYALGRWFGGG